MEGFPQNLSETKEGVISIEQSIDRVKTACVQAAEKYFEDGDPLKKKIIQYYQDRPETDKELETILGKISEEDREKRVESYEAYANNQTVFTEEMERFFDRVGMYKRQKELVVEPEPATEEEYELGTYFDYLEPQVRDAVREMQKKGYQTFQSGFDEKNKRDQFFDFYDRNILVSEAVIKKFKEKSIEVKIQKFDDRTTVTFHPLGSSPVRLAEWKELLEDFAKSLPETDKELVPNVKRYDNYNNFRATQDRIKNSQESN